MAARIPEPGRHIDLSDVYAGLPPIDTLPRRPRTPSPAMQAALAAFEDHARRWVRARRDTLAELGCTAAPCRDGLPIIETTPAPRRSLSGWIV